MLPPGWVCPAVADSSISDDKRQPAVGDEIPCDGIAAEDASNVVPAGPNDDTRQAPKRRPQGAVACHRVGGEGWREAWCSRREPTLSPSIGRQATNARTRLILANVLKHGAHVPVGFHSRSPRASARGLWVVDKKPRAEAGAAIIGAAGRRFSPRRRRSRPRCHRWPPAGLPTAECRQAAAGRPRGRAASAAARVLRSPRPP